MSYHLMFIVNAFVLAASGGALLIAPEAVLSQFQSEIYVATLYAARFMGGSLLVGGLLLWFLQDIPQKKQKLASFFLLAASIGGFVLSLFGMTSIGVLRANGWILLVVFGLFALIYAYLLFLQPKPAPAKSSAPRKPKPAPASNNGQPLQ
jgi:hypothetical protein